MLVCHTDMLVSCTDMSVLYTDMSVSHTYRKYVTVFACICTYFGKCQRPFARPRSLTRRRVIATVRVCAGAWSLHVRRAVAAGSLSRGQAQANNQQIYLDQVRSTGQRQPQVTWTAATLLRVEVPWRCWMPVVYLKATEKRYR